MTRVVLAVLLLLAFPGVAHAKPGNEQARAIYAKGKAAYERGEFAEALTNFEQAYRLSPTPALLFNMAQAHRLSGPEHCSQALDLYRRYLAEDPEAKNRTEATERIDEMQACVSREGENTGAPAAKSEEPPARAPEPTAVPSPRPEPRARPAAPPDRAPLAPPPERTRPTAAIIVAGAGAALGVAGVIIYARARAKYDEVERTCPCPPGSFSNWETLTSVSYGLMAAGALGTAGGISWYLLGGESGRSAPRGAVVNVAVRF